MRTGGHDFETSRIQDLRVVKRHYLHMDFIVFRSSWKQETIKCNREERRGV